MAGEKKRYTLGRGELHFAQFRAGTLLPRGELYMGNSPAFSLTATQENLDHYSSDAGVRQKDDSILLQLDYASALTVDNIDLDNLGYFFLGEKRTINTVETPVAAETLALVEKGRWYQLGTSDVNPSGVRGVSAVTLTPTPAGTAYVAGTDYLLDLENGRVFIQPAGAITDGSSPTVAYTIGAASRDQIITSGKVIEGALRYLSKNPAGLQINYFMPHVKFTPNGEFALKGDTWQELQFNVEVLQKNSLAAIYLDGAPFNPAA